MGDGLGGLELIWRLIKGTFYVVAGGSVALLAGQCIYYHYKEITTVLVLVIAGRLIRFGYDKIRERLSRPPRVTLAPLN